jgi:uncharacterized protein
MNADEQSIVRDAEEWVRSLLEKESTGHDWHHIMRVRKTATTIAQEEGVSLFLVDLMVLLHELPDRKLELFPSEAEALKAVHDWLSSRGVPQEHTEEILYVIENQSYSKSGVTNQKLTSQAGQVVQDADRLDGLGAIGVARCFAHGGKKKRPLYNPDIPLQKEVNFEKYWEGSPSSLHHFPEKLLKLKDQMNTAAGRRLAEDRHQFTQEFFNRFLEEWEGKQ